MARFLRGVVTGRHAQIADCSEVEIVPRLMPFCLLGEAIGGT
jgi:hypothetical protein